MSCLAVLAWPPDGVTCTAMPAGRAQYEVIPHLVRTPRPPACEWLQRNASQVLPIWPRDAHRRRFQRRILRVISALWAGSGLLAVPRRGSALEVYRGRRGDVDLDFFLIYPRSMSLACALVAIHDAVRAAGYADVMDVSSSYPVGGLVFDRFLPVMVRSEREGNIKVDLELFREDLLVDAGYASRMKAYPGNAGISIGEYFTVPVCTCTLPDVAPDVQLLCLDDPDMALHLTAYYGPGFMVPQEYESDCDLRSFRLFWRLPLVRPAFEHVYTFVSAAHKWLVPPPAA